MKSDNAYIVLAVIIVLLIGVVFFVSNENKKEKYEMLNAEVTEEIKIDDNIKTLYSLLLKWNKFESIDDVISRDPNDSYLGTFYTNERVSSFRYTKEQKYAAVFLALKNPEQMADKTYESKSGYGFDTYQINKYSLDEAKKVMHQLFDDIGELQEMNLQIGNEVVEYTTDGVYSYKTSGEEVQRKEFAFSKLYKAEKNNEHKEIYLYDKYVFCIVKTDEDGTNRIEAYTNSNMTDKISDDVSDIINSSDDETVIVDKIIEEYPDEVKSYKHTFRLDDNNNYNWACSEIINDF